MKLISKAPHQRGLIQQRTFGSNLTWSLFGITIRTRPIRKPPTAEAVAKAWAEAMPNFGYPGRWEDLVRADHHRDYLTCARAVLELLK